MSEIKIKAWISFYLELPFQLGLPTGHYALNIPSQLKLHRDLYYIQKGNEIENPSTIENYVIPQERLFNEKGLCSEEFENYYKRKLKTTIFRKFTISYTLLNMSEAVFYEKIKNKKVNYKNLGIPAELIYKYQKEFIEEVNSFLKYYSNFFPINKPESSLQHEVRPLSIFEVSDCLLEPMFIVKIDDIDYAIMLRKIILDFHEQSRIPSLTYTNVKKIEEFEKVLLDRQKYKIFPYQDLFNISRAYYRTHRETKTSVIIVNCLISLESIFNYLEENVTRFQNHKIERERRNKAILNFYTNYRAQYTKDFLEQVLGYTSKEALDLVEYFNHGRNIRNQIVHKLKLEYDKNSDELKYTFSNNTITLKFKKLWAHLIQLYNSLNLYVMKREYPSIQWELDSTHESTIIGIASGVSENSIIPIFPNHDWRETYSYNYILPDFSIPPERIARAIQSKDGEPIPINFNPDKIEHEYYNQVNFPDKVARLEVDINNLELSEEELNEKIVNRDLLINFINPQKKIIAKYIICKKCGKFCSVDHIAHYKKETCPYCKEKLFEIL